MTLKGSNDFKLEDFYSAPSELFEPYYGEVFRFSHTHRVGLTINMTENDL